MRTFLLLLLATGACARSAAQGVPAASDGQLVILVRHAEKVDESDDPTLSELGRARAAALAEALRHAGVRRVVVSHRRRTTDTAAPLMQAQSIVPEAVPVGRSVPEHAREVARRVRAGGGTTLVVGHSNTIPAIVSELTGVPLADLCDAEYATLFVVSIPATGPGTFVRSRFGPPDESAARCGAMTPR